jgi:hypothetical protein
MKQNKCKHWVTTDCSYGEPFCKYCGMSGESVHNEEQKKEKVSKMKSLNAQVNIQVKAAFTAYNKAYTAADVKAAKSYAEADKVIATANILAVKLTEKANKAYDKEIKQADLLYKRMLKGKKS